MVPYSIAMWPNQPVVISLDRSSAGGRRTGTVVHRKKGVSAVVHQYIGGHGVKRQVKIHRGVAIEKGGRCGVLRPPVAEYLRGSISTGALIGPFSNATAGYRHPGIAFQPEFEVGAYAAWGLCVKYSSHQNEEKSQEEKGRGFVIFFHEADYSPVEWAVLNTLDMIVLRACRNNSFLVNKVLFMAIYGK